MKHISLERLWSEGRKAGIILLACVMLVSITACGQTDVVEETPITSQETESVTKQTSEATEDANTGSEVSAGSGVEDAEGVQSKEPKRKTEKMVLTINEEVVSVEWEDNESVEALMEIVSTEPLSIQMSMYGGFEQVGSIGTSLPRNDVQTTTRAGDIVLYSGNQIVIFYGSNSWTYTRLGKVTDKTNAEMMDLLGNGDVIITISMEEQQ